MTAPTPRETADHAELARLAEALRKPEIWQSYPGPEGDFEIRLAPFDAATGLENLLSEIAALREEREANWQEYLEERSARMDAGTREYALGERLTQAERQRDEARDTIASTVAKADWMQGHLSGERASIDRETIELVVSECRAYCHLQALANQGADQ